MSGVRHRRNRKSRTGRQAVDHDGHWFSISPRFNSPPSPLGMSLLDAPPAMNRRGSPCCLPNQVAPSLPCARYRSHAQPYNMDQLPLRVGEHKLVLVAINSLFRQLTAADFIAVRGLPDNSLTTANGLIARNCPSINHLLKGRRNYTDLRAKIRGFWEGVFDGSCGQRILSRPLRAPGLIKNDLAPRQQMYVTFRPSATTDLLKNLSPGHQGWHQFGAVVG
jgi:hypothetical protein